MKFTIAVVVLVLAVSAQSNLVPLTWSGINGLEKSIAYSTPLTSIGLTARVAPLTPYSSFAPIAYTSHATRLAYVPSYSPTVRITPQAPLVVQSVVPVPTEGSYVAANRGAVHIADLPGHSLSAASINLDAAPGTL